jgi:hypothetical protein
MCRRDAKQHLRRSAGRRPLRRRQRERGLKVILPQVYRRERGPTEMEVVRGKTERSGTARAGAAMAEKSGSVSGSVSPVFAPFSAFENRHRCSVPPMKPGILALSNFEAQCLWIRRVLVRSQEGQLASTQSPTTRYVLSGSFASRWCLFPRTALLQQYRCRVSYARMEDAGSLGDARGRHSRLALG